MKKYSARVAVCGYVEFDFNHKYGDESVREQAKRIARSLEDMTSDISVKATTFKLDSIKVVESSDWCGKFVDKKEPESICNKCKHFLIFNCSKMEGYPLGSAPSGRPVTACFHFQSKPEPEPKKESVDKESVDVDCRACKHSVVTGLDEISCESLGVSHKNNAITKGHCSSFKEKEPEPEPEPEIPESKIIPAKCISCAYYPEFCNMHFVCDRYMPRV